MSDGHNASVANEQLGRSNIAPIATTCDLFNTMPPNTTCFDFVSAQMRQETIIFERNKYTS